MASSEAIWEVAVMDGVPSKAVWAKGRAAAKMASLEGVRVKRAVVEVE
jgi:hypothetical protein